MVVLFVWLSVFVVVQIVDFYCVFILMVIDLVLGVEVIDVIECVCQDFVLVGG